CIMIINPAGPFSPWPSRWSASLMHRRLAIGLLCAGVFLTCLRVPAQEKKPAATADFVKDIAPIFAKYCTTCHSGAKPKGSLSLDFKDAATAATNKRTWEKVVHRLRTGAMPPEGKPRPTLEEFDRILAWIDTDMLAVDCKGKRNPGRVTIRRLNKAEYN